MTNTPSPIAVSHGQSHAREALRTDPELAGVLQGLRGKPPRLSPRWFYDALGSALFEAITRLDGYYLTGCELEILEGPARELGASLAEGLAVVELGSGSADKIARLLPGLRAPRAFHPVDVSRAALRVTERQLRAAFPDLPVEGLQADFGARARMQPLLRSLAEQGPLLLFFPGSTVGNLERDQAVALLHDLATAVPAGTPLLLGVDLVKPWSLLEDAYDDPAGVTAAFNRNALCHLNARFGSDFQPRRFRHEARWNEGHQRVEMWLCSDGEQTVKFGDARLHFREGVDIHTESSHKYDRRRVQQLAARAGWHLTAWITDTRGYFAEALLLRTADTDHASGF
ncbi:MAG: L-histidine N(alpha)-methyltransferase [Myxococcales bacterium]|nr:L-histidine N(alpha)-methyltransferase [Myxococcales bacterium]